MGGPLAGVRVIDLCQYANGPVGAGQLADQGADVLKVEPAAGEGQRHTAPPGRMNSMLEVGSRGKRSMTLDLKHPGALAVMERLCKWADVLAENFRPGVMDKLGLSYDVVRGWNPRLIYASNSGLGARGEWADRPSYDGIGQAFSGVLTSNAGGPSHRPREVPWVFSDIVGANNFYAAILAALVARGRTGRGQHVVTSQTGAALFFQQCQIWESFNWGVPPGSQDDSGKDPWMHAPWQQVHRAGDGRWLVLSFIQLRQFERFCNAVLRRPDLLKPEVVKRWPGSRPDDQAWLRAEIAAEIAKHPVAHWLRVVPAADVPCAPVATYADIGDAGHTVGRQLRENGYVVDAPHRDYGVLKMIAPPVRFSDTPGRYEDPVRASVHAPALGEHNADVLRELGYSGAEAAALLRSGVVPQPTGPHERAASAEKRARFIRSLAERRAKAAAEAAAGASPSASASKL